MTVLLVVLAALAATRWATLVVLDSFGPIADVRDWIEYRFPAPHTRFYREHVIPEQVGDVTVWRNRAGVSLMPDPDANDGGYMAVDPHPLGTLFTCPRCMSVWTGTLALVTLVFLPASVAFVVFAPFAFSEVAIWRTHSE